MTAEVVMNVTTYLAAITDLGNRMESDHSKLNMQVMADYGEVNREYWCTKEPLKYSPRGQKKATLEVHEASLNINR